MSEWISVKDRLPVVGDVILFYDTFCECVIYGYRGEFGYLDLIGEFPDEYHSVTHWMPLPEAPRE